MAEASPASVEPACRTFSPLAHLTNHSARFGLWEVAIFNPIARAREYVWNQQKRISYSFQCVLVSTTDPRQYMLGDSHGQGITADKFQSMKLKFKDGLVFHMSKVVFAANCKQQYNSTPKTEVISMLSTTWPPVLAGAGKPCMPEPAIPIAASMGIEREQLFDALALVQNVSETMRGGKTASGQARSRCTILLNDGSRSNAKDSAAAQSLDKDSPVLQSMGKVCHLPVTVFADTNSDGTEPQLFQILRLAVSNKTAMAFFGIQGKQPETKEAKWSFTSSFGFHVQRASDTKRGKELEDYADEILATEGEAVPVAMPPGRELDQNESFADQEAKETTCAILQSILSKTNVKAIEDQTTFWQINWRHVQPPEKAAQICTNDNSRLWMRVKVEDNTGYVHLYMREKAALALSGLDTKDEFEAARAFDTMDFPNKVSVKILRKEGALQTPTAGDSAEKPAPINCYIVEAAEQAIEDTPSKSSLILLFLLERTEMNTDACAPAAVKMIRKDPHYGLSVSYQVSGECFKKQCTRAIALIVTSSPSRSEIMNEGYQMITEGVKDALDDSYSCTLMSFCTVKASPDYQLKPARGMKTQTALVVIADILEEGSAEKPSVLLVESLEKIPDAEAQLAPEHIRRRIQFAALAAKMQGKSSVRGWTENMSPASAGKCRRLGKAPTGEELDKYTMP